MDILSEQILRYGLLAAAEEMKEMAMRASHSPLWREAGDLSCAILTSSGDVVVQGPADLPAHLATMPLSVRGALEVLKELSPGDLILMNEPAIGNNHLPDCLLFAPIYYEGNMVAIAAVRGHWPDIGGSSPGSYTTLTTSAFEEGLRIPPIRLWQNGRLQQDLLGLILANVRGSEERHGDLMAQYVGVHVAVAKVRELCDRFGAKALVETMDHILDASEASARSVISNLPDGRYSEVTWLDGDGVDDKLIRIQADVEIRGDEIVVDLSGSDIQVRGGMNCPYAVTVSAVHSAVKVITDPLGPGNSGCYRPVRVAAKEGSVLSPIHPCPVIGGNVETSSRVFEAVLGALGKAAPDRAMAGGCGSAIVTIIAGESGPSTAVGSRVHGSEGQSDGSEVPHARDTHQYVYMENAGGAWGGRAGLDGVSATRVGVGNTGTTPIEVVEAKYPVRIEEYAIVADREGPGAFRGGLPIRRITRVLEDAIVTVTGDCCRTQPIGLAGGEPGASATYRLVTEEGERELFSKVGPISVKAGSCLVVEGAGGGGFGATGERDPALIEADLVEEYITAERAQAVYGWRRPAAV